jgi:hypothetical protein
MKPINCGILAAFIALCPVIGAQAAENQCDCTTFPFLPDPPCADNCMAKHLAIASLEDLETIFGLPENAAKTIDQISPRNRPRSVEGYSQILSENAYEALQKRVRAITGAELAQVRDDARLAIDRFDF